MGWWRDGPHPARQGEVRPASVLQSRPLSAGETGVAVHVAEMYAAMVAQRRAVLAALRSAPADLLQRPVDVSGGAVLGHLRYLARLEHEAIARTLRLPGSTLEAETLWASSGDPAESELTLAGVEAGWVAVEREWRRYITTEKPYDFVFPRRNLGAGGTPELILWGVIMHEMGEMGRLAAACAGLGITLPPLAPVEHLQRNPELGRWWMAEKY